MKNKKRTSYLPTSRYNQRRYWTKDEIATVIDLWQSSSLDDIALKLQRERKHIVYIAAQIRKAGYQLPKKRINGKLKSLISEVLLEKRLK